MQEKVGSEAREKVQALINDVRIAMLATRGEDGFFHARPMATSEVKFDGTLWFLTDRRTHKVAQLESDSEVLVTYSGGQNYVSVAGTGAIVDTPDTVKHLWSEAARPWFPKGLDDPNLVALRIDVEVAEYWDIPSGMLVVAYGYLKAVTTGKRADDAPLSEHGVARY